ncbi:MAG: type IV toxin-antitoxin system AbiEi family antitoxin domain-containing protein [Candidatus Rhabdochlamydia sp.]
MKPLKYLEQLSCFEHAPFFTVKEASLRQVPRHALAYLVKRGDLERIHTGTYRFVSYEPEVEFQWEHLALAAATVLEGVICLISALYYYNLTDQGMKEIWIAIPHACHAPKRAGVRIVRMRNTTLGKTFIMLGEYPVHIFDKERCVIDAFRYLSQEIALKALQNYFKASLKPDLKTLQDYAKKLRVNITPYLLSYTT